MSALGKYSKFASADEKATVRAAVAELAQVQPEASLPDAEPVADNLPDEPF